MAVFQAGPLGVSRSRDARLWARPWSGLSGPLPAWHVERPRKSPEWLLAFVAAISCCCGEDFSGSCVSMCAHVWRIVSTVPHLAKTARRNVYARVSSFYGLILCCRSRTSYDKENCPYCLYVGHSSDICLTLRNAKFPLNAKSAMLLPATVRVEIKMQYTYCNLHGVNLRYHLLMSRVKKEIFENFDILEAFVQKGLNVWNMRECAEHSI